MPDALRVLCSALRIREGSRAGVAAQAICAGLVAFAYAYWVLSGVPSHHPSADSHYHFSVAQEIGRGSLAPDPSRGLPFTVLREMPVDHYWGFHLLLAPFTWFADYKLGLRVAAATGFAGVFASLSAFIAARRVPNAALWALCSALFANQDWRYLQLRGAQCMLPLVLAIVELAGFRRTPGRGYFSWRSVALAITALIGIWCYHGALLLLPFAFVASLAAHAFDPARSAWRSRITAVLHDVACVSGGLALGLLVNPYMNAQFATFRFLIFHVTNMVADPQNLYADVFAEFRGFPADYLVFMPEWGLLFLATVGAVLWVSSRGLVRRQPGRGPRVLAALCLLGMLLMSRALRMREYAVPMAFALLASVWGRRARPALAVGATGFGLLIWAMALRAPRTRAQIGESLATDIFAGARDVLASNARRPILNLAEADFGMLRIQYPEVVCIHALSRYFIYPYRDLHRDVWFVYHQALRSDAATRATLRRFAERGVRLVATHGNRALDVWAQAHPEVLRVVYLSPVSRARIYELVSP